MIAFSKIEGLEVTPRSESSTMRRASSPLSISERRRRSSHGLVPASTNARRFGLTFVASVVLIGSGLLGWLQNGFEDSPCAHPRRAFFGIAATGSTEQHPVSPVLLGRDSAHLSHRLTDRHQLDLC